MYLKLLKDFDRYQLEQREKDNREKREYRKRQAINERIANAEKTAEEDCVLAKVIKEIQSKNESNRMAKINLERERSKREDIFFKD